MTPPRKKRLTRNQKIIENFKDGRDVAALANAYRMSREEIETIIRRHCRKLKGA